MKTSNKQFYPETQIHRKNCHTTSRISYIGDSVAKHAIRRQINGFQSRKFKITQATALSKEAMPINLKKCTENKNSKKA